MSIFDSFDPMARVPFVRNGEPWIALAECKQPFMEKKMEVVLAIRGIAEPVDGPWEVFAMPAPAEEERKAGIEWLEAKKKKASEG